MHALNHLFRARQNQLKRSDCGVCEQCFLQRAFARVTHPPQSCLNVLGVDFNSWRSFLCDCGCGCCCTTQSQHCQRCVCPERFCQCAHTFISNDVGCECIACLFLMCFLRLLPTIVVAAHISNQAQQALCCFSALWPKPVLLSYKSCFLLVLAVFHVLLCLLVLCWSHSPLKSNTFSVVFTWSASLNK